MCSYTLPNTYTQACKRKNYFWNLFARQKSLLLIYLKTPFPLFSSFQEMEQSADVVTHHGHFIKSTQTGCYSWHVEGTETPTILLQAQCCPPSAAWPSLSERHHNRLPCAEASRGKLSWKLIRCLWRESLHAISLGCVCLSTC